jgi:hypothetical protein
VDRELVQRAQEVLARNRRGGWTCPSTDLYPHQWLWDSCFTAIGLARVDARRAADELRALFRGQWANGMLPHMVFADDSQDLGSRTIWQSRRHAGAPRDVATTCITQPPLPAVAAWHVSGALPQPARDAFQQDLFPKLVAYHTWLYAARDPDRRGLVTLVHPWESGLDTTPPWMYALRRMRLPTWLELAERIRLARVLRRARYDTRLLPAADRAADDDGFRMVALAVHLKRYGFDLARIPRDGRCALVEDLGFNAMLVVANRALARIADQLGAALPTRLADAAARTETALETLWDEESARYCSRDATTGELLTQPTVASFLPLWSGCITGERADLLIDALQRPGSWPTHPVPSVPVDAPGFSAHRYWQGPTWVNMNWAIIEGLRAYGAAELADELRERTLAMVNRVGFFEYFSPLTGEGLGPDDFSWTAALVVDLASESSQSTGS